MQIMQEHSVVRFMANITLFMLGAEWPLSYAAAFLLIAKCIRKKIHRAYEFMDQIQIIDKLYKYLGINRFCYK